MGDSPLDVRARVPLSIVTLVLLAVSMTALGPVIDGGEWWLPAVFTSLVVIASGLGLRAVRVPQLLVPAGQAVVLLFVLMMAFAADTAFAAVIPTGATFDVFGQLLDGARRTITQQAAPAVAVPALVFALMLGAGLLAIIADSAVQILRVPALAAVSALVPILIPALITGSGNAAVALVLTGGAFLWLLGSDVRARRRFAERELLHGEVRNDEEVGASPIVIAPKRVPVASTLGSTAGLAVAGVLIASLVASMTPSLPGDLFSTQVSSGSVFGRGVSPFVDLGRDLRRPAARPAFHYTSPDGDRPYFTLVTIDEFTGDIWAASDRPIDGDNRATEFPRPPGLAADVAASEHSVSVVIDELRTTWLPVPTPTTAIEGLRGSWFWEEESRAVRSVDTDTGGQRYTVRTLIADVTREQLQAAGGTVPDSLASYLELPEELPPSIVDTASALIGDSPSPYESAVRIQEFLRGQRFTYSVDAPAHAEVGGGFGVIDAFLQSGTGYCVHFASTMAVLSREAGIPSRIAIGYAQGSGSTERVDGAARIDVDSHDLHAWPELYFSGLGWVPFEPTPSRGTVPEYSRRGSASVPLSPQGEASAPTNGPERPDSDPGRDGSAAGLGESSTSSVPMESVIGALLMVLILLLIPGIGRWVVGVWRGRRARAGDAEAAWREFTALAVDLGVATGDGETVRAFVARLGVPGAVRLRDAVESSRYASADVAPTVGFELSAALDEACSALRADATPAERFRARTVPASVLGRRRRGLGRRAVRGA